MKNILCAAVVILAFANIASRAYADNNSFFGANPSPAANSSSDTGSNNQDYTKDLPEDTNPNAVLPGLNDTTPNKSNKMSDFTGDEKRMQQKYKSNMINAQQLMAKGERMMKAAGGDANRPEYKKGKILKEIGEKSLTDLKANNPFPDQKVK